MERESCSLLPQKLSLKSCRRWYLRSIYRGISAGSGTGQWHYGSDGGGPDSGVGRLHPRRHPTSVTLGAFCRNRLWFQRRSSSSTSFARPPSCRGFALGFSSFRKGECLQCRVRGRDSFSKAEKAKEASEKAWRRRAYNYRKGCASGKATHFGNSVSIPGASDGSDSPADLSGSAHCRSPEKFETRVMETQLGPKSHLGEPFSGTQAGTSLGVIAKGFGSKTTSQPPLGLLGPLMNVNKPNTSWSWRRRKGKRISRTRPILQKQSLPRALTIRLQQHVRTLGQIFRLQEQVPKATSKRVGYAPRHLLHIGSASNVEKDGANQQLRDDTGADDGQRNHVVPGTWRDSGATVAFASADSCNSKSSQRCDYLMEDNIPAAKDTIALLAVTIEQGS